MAKKTKSYNGKLNQTDFQSLLDMAPDAFFLGNGKGEFLWCNRKAVLLTGFSVNELQKMEMKDLFPDEELKIKPLQYEALDRGEIIIARRWLKRKDGKSIPIEMHSRKNPDGTYQSILRDISARIQMEEALRNSERKYRELFEKSNDAILIIENNTFVDCNAAAVKLLGYGNKTDLLNTHPSELSPEFQPDGQFSYEKAEEMMNIAIKRGWHRFEWNHKKADGTVFPVEVLLTAVEIEDDKKILHTVWRDITGRKKAENFQKVQYDFVKRLIAASDIKDVYEASFDELSLLLKIERGMVLGPLQPRVEIQYCYHCSKKYALEFYQAYESDFATVIENPGIRMIPASKRKNGGTNPLYIIPLSDNDTVSGLWIAEGDEIGTPDQALEQLLESMMRQMQTVVSNIKNQESLYQSEERFRTIFHESPIGIFYFNGAGVITECNKTFVDILGSSRDNLIGFNMLERVQDMQLIDAIRQALKEGYAFYEDWYHPVTGKKDSYVRVHLKGLEDGRGRIKAGIGMVEDFTSTKRLEEQLVHSQKMEAVGKLAGGIAHDFNNILTIINGYAEMLLLNKKVDSTILQKVAQIHKAGQHAASLTGQLLAFSRKQVIQPVVMDCRNSLGLLEGILKRLIGEDIKLEFDIPGDELLIKIDPGQFEQILVNMVINARDAMPQGGKIVISAGEEKCPPEFSETYPEFNAQERIWISIRDSGVGIDPEVLPRIFEPFFTTKKVGQGTGLGLAMVYGIVKQANGVIEVESKKNDGTVFTLFFPKYHERVEVRGLNEEEEQFLKGSETILLIEDEKALREMVEELLSDLGYKVFAASDGEEGLELFRQHTDKIDMVLSDVIMPGLNGKLVVKKILEYAPDMKVCFMSGYTKDVFSMKGIEGPEFNFIQKPFSGKKLVQTIRKILD